MTKFQRIVFFSLVLLFPLNVGKHFVLPESFVSGFLIDYLVPTVFLSDLLIFLLLISYLLELRIIFKRPLPLIRIRNLLPLFFILLLIPSVFVAVNKAAAFYKWLKYAEFLFLAFFLSKKVDLGIIRRSQAFLFSAVFLESVLAIAQWLKQGYIFGYLPLGESLIAARPPFALADFAGSLKLRVYGTFPHPNVLGGYLAITLPLIFLSLSSEGLTIRRRVLYSLTFVLGLAALFLTFSRAAGAAFVFALAIILLKKRLAAAFTILFIAFALWLTFSASVSNLLDKDAPSLIRRVELTSAALSMFSEKPLTGVGLNNFTVRL